MNYHTEITFHQGTEREFTYEGVFANVNDAIEHIEHTIQGNGTSVRVWLNNCEVNVKGGKVMTADGKPLTEVWDKLIASPYLNAAFSSYGEHYLKALNQQNAGEI